MKRSKSIPDILAANIKRRRTELELTQSKLAERLEISSTYMAELETGRKSASLEVIQRLAYSGPNLPVIPAETCHPKNAYSGPNLPL